MYCTFMFFEASPHCNPAESKLSLAALSAFQSTQSVRSPLMFARVCVALLSVRRPNSKPESHARMYIAVSKHIHLGVRAKNHRVGQVCVRASRLPWCSSHSPLSLGAFRAVAFNHWGQSKLPNSLAAQTSRANIITEAYLIISPACSRARSPEPLWGCDRFFLFFRFLSSYFPRVETAARGMRRMGVCVVLVSSLCRRKSPQMAGWNLITGSP